MPGWAIIIIVFVVIGALIGIFASFDKGSDMNPGQGCLAGALTGGASGMGCLAVILEAILPLALAFLLLSWLFNGCS